MEHIKFVLVWDPDPHERAFQQAVRKVLEAKKRDYTT